LAISHERPRLFSAMNQYDATSDRCPYCGRDFAVFGRVHRCPVDGGFASTVLAMPRPRPEPKLRTVTDPYTGAAAPWPPPTQAEAPAPKRKRARGARGLRAPVVNLSFSVAYEERR
jgi:hypothetical protein